MEFDTKEIHYIGMNFIGEKLQDMGYEFLSVNSKLKKHPQFVLFKKNEPITFVIVRTVLYPTDFDVIPDYAEKVIEHAKGQESNVWYAGVGVKDVENPNDIPSQGKPYEVIFRDFQKLYIQ